MMNIATLFPLSVLKSLKRYAIRLGMIVLVSLLLADCSVTGTFRNDSSTEIQYDSHKNAAYYLNLMNKERLPDAQIQLFAIRALLQENRLDEARIQIEGLPAFLSTEQETDKTLVISDLASRQESDIHLHAINKNTLTIPQKRYFYQIKLHEDQRKKDINGIVRDYIVLENLAPEAEQPQLVNETWEYFKSLNNEELEKIVVFSNEVILKGWYDLTDSYHRALKVETLPVFNDNNNTLELVTPTLTKKEIKTRIAKVASEWQIAYPDHPAAKMPPKELQLSVKKFAAKAALGQQGKRVALLLPLTGHSKIFGEVVQAGYEDANKYYPDEPVQRIRVFDTNGDSIAHLVSQAKSWGAQLIVGPLLKEDVISISRQPGSIPVLALNKLPAIPPPGHNKICYFGLSPEDEVSSAVQHIYAQGKRRPLIITSDNAMGHRIVQAFNQEWQQRYSTPVYVQYFQSSQQLKEKMNQGDGLRVEGDLVFPAPAQSDIPTTTRDIDSIYIFSTQDELEFIKPMIDMKTSVNTRTGQSNGPFLYTSSRSQNASGTPDYRYEMERVQFSDIPLLVTKNSVLAMLPGFIKRDYSRARLYAMGIDAWRLANRFDELGQKKEPVINGLTGRIRISGNCEVDRSLPWRIYQQGQVKAVD